MNEILLIILIVIASAIGAYIGTRQFISRVSWKIKLNEATEVIEITPLQPKKKAEFIPDLTQQELDELDKEPALKRFFNKFKKPKKNE